MYELVPLHPTTDGYHNASGLMCEWSVLPGPMAVPWTPQLQPSSAATSPEPAGAHTIVLWAHFLADITRQLVSWVNPEVQVTNSDLYLASSMLHHACMANYFDIRERTTLSFTDNTAGLL